MKVTFKPLTALLVGAVVAGIAGFVPGAPAFAEVKNKQTVSKEVGKPLKAAEEAMKAKKYPEALAKLKEAQALPKKSPYEEHIINEMLGYVYARTSNYADAAKAYEAELGDGFLEESEIPKRVVALAEINLSIKNYDKAIEFGTRAVKGGYADEKVYTILGQAYYLKGDYKGSVKFEEPYIESEIKKGQTPKSEPLQLLLSSCVKLGDTDCTTRALEKMVAYYPKQEYWQDLLYTLYTSASQNDKSMLHTFRLMSEVDVLKRPDDYTEMAQLAIEAGSPGEAQRILEKAFQKNVFTDARAQDKNKRLLESAKKAAASDLAQLPKIQVDADAAPTGDKEIGVGLAYLGYEQYDKAVDALSKGLSKGGVRNEPEARLLLGIAQLKAGHKDEAVKSFRAVKGDPNLERLANLWSLHAKQA